MKCRAILSDIDGTLTLGRNTYELSVEAVLALRRAKDAGLLVGLVTANGLDYALTLARYLGVNGPVIAEGGCLVHWHGEVIHLCSGDPSAIRAALEPQPWLKPSYQNRCRVYDMAYIPLIDAEEAVKRVRELLPWAYVEWSGYAIHVKPSRVSKGDAVRRICEWLGLNCWEVVVIGDGDNDAEMLSVGFGVAVGNASEAAKTAAKLVVDLPSGLGVAEFVDLLLGGFVDCSPEGF